MPKTPSGSFIYARRLKFIILLQEVCSCLFLNKQFTQSVFDMYIEGALVGRKFVRLTKRERYVMTLCVSTL